MKTKKVVINNCFGGFGLSPLAIKEISKRKGKQCFFFKHEYKVKQYIPLTLEEAQKEMIWFAYSVPNPQDFRLSEADKDGLYKEANKRAEEIGVDDFRENREDQDFVAVVKKLGKKANGFCAELKIVEIPADVKYVIEEYDGMETIAEEHQTWS